MIQMHFTARKMAVALLMTATSLTAVPLLASDAPPAGTSAAEQAAVRADPVFHPQKLKLIELPPPLEPARALFNGRDLRGWDVWLGLTDPAKTFSATHDTPIGLNKDKAHVFRVVMEDEAPAIFTNGKIFGALITKKSYSNYHLRLEFKWGKNTVPGVTRNSGLLYHSRGAYGAFFSTWMSSVEFQMMHGSLGMAIAVGDNLRTESPFQIDQATGVKVPVGHDPKLPYPSRRYMLGGRLVPIAAPAYNVEAASDAEKPIGEWNTIDLYAVGDRSIHVVNGVPVLAAEELTATDKHGGKARPLTGGRLQLESEGAEVYFRNIMIEPIGRLPKIIAE